MEVAAGHRAPVGQRIDARISELGLTRAAVQRAADIAEPTLRGWIEDKPIGRWDKARRLSEALGWTPDSIERLSRGQEPKLADASGTTKHDRELAALRADMAALRTELADVTARLNRMSDEAPAS